MGLARDRLAVGGVVDEVVDRVEPDLATVGLSFEWAPRGMDDGATGR
jgi:hypothetical protein